MRRATLIAFASVALLLGALGTSMALGFHPIDSVTNAFEDACDAPEAGEAASANTTAAADPCGDGESQDDGPTHS